VSWIPTWDEEDLDSPPNLIIEGQLHKNKLQRIISFKLKRMAIFDREEKERIVFLL
jgi:hypothetical protein